MNLQQMGKIIITVGLLFLIVGGFIWLIGRTGIRRLPGDIVIRRGNFTLYFPIVTCLVISAVLSLLFYIIGKFK
ncbi:DUF2905 domain-containing protein [Mahella sp.]|uniref:DUF2905 domain-containing protein n=1 Tax=Mahella sp. TaxID=2798721 RepID=UPI0025C1280F|nr:DUF2905 domain-containing protein [Mahella sp.]MBZ4665338.1 hypothetical protein [Mahella sp.]MDK2903574.1 hypothetical protein [Clostridiales bacterium]